MFVVKYVMEMVQEVAKSAKMHPMHPTELSI